MREYLRLRIVIKNEPRSGAIALALNNFFDEIDCSNKCHDYVSFWREDLICYPDQNLIEIDSESAMPDYIVQELFPETFEYILAHVKDATFDAETYWYSDDVAEETTNYICKDGKCTSERDVRVVFDESIFNSKNPNQKIREHLRTCISKYNDNNYESMIEWFEENGTNDGLLISEEDYESLSLKEKCVESLLANWHTDGRCNYCYFKDYLDDLDDFIYDIADMYNEDLDDED